jgi:hypothetical protein
MKSNQQESPRFPVDVIIPLLNAFARPTFAILAEFPEDVGARVST